jgi:hypothetical protein
MVAALNHVLLALFFWVWLWNGYIFLFNRGVPNIRTAPAIRKRIIGLLKEDMARKNGVSYWIVDLGSGNGLLTREIARALPEACIYGFEISFLAFHWSEYFRKASGLKNLTYVHGDFLKHDIGKADAVIVFLTVYDMMQVGEKLKRELKDDTLVTSNKFALTGWAPAKIMDVKTLYLHQKELYVYRACAAAAAIVEAQADELLRA